VPTTYAKLLAVQGFIILVFDASYQGESGGEPHFSEFPAARVEDIRGNQRAPEAFVRYLR